MGRTATLRRMKTSTFRVLCACAAVVFGSALSLPAAAQWKWKDASGNVHFSDRPPPNSVPERDILQKGPVRPVAPAAAASAASAPEAGKLPVDKELEARKRQGDQAQEVRRKTDDERLAIARAENCERARGHLRTLESGVRIARTNEKGEREILSDAQRNQEMERMRQAIAGDCR